MKALRIGTRGSDLALAQTRWVAARLEAATRRSVEVVVIETTGDRRRDVPLNTLGGAGVFVKELETALLARDVDAAVHSLKDLPTAQPDGLCVAAVPGRADPRDVLVAARGQTLAALPASARVGTSSPRRKAQLLAARPDLTVEPVRGNVGTRLGKVTGGELDAVVLAAAGLDRLGLADAVTERLEPGVMLPAPGQGALAVECRVHDPATRELLSVLHDVDAAAAVAAERRCLAALGGGCHTPLGALGRVVDGTLRLAACVCAEDGATVLRAEADGAPCEPERVGDAAAAKLLDQGAKALVTG